MIVEEPECLRHWLTAVLRPLCDADPAALAKYVLALIKKDKTDEELRQGMIDQLDVFLQNETKGFVEILFKVLVTKEYLPPAESVTSEESAASGGSVTSKQSKASKSSTVTKMSTGSKTSGNSRASGHSKGSYHSNASLPSYESMSSQESTPKSKRSFDAAAGSASETNGSSSFNSSNDDHSASFELSEGRSATAFKRDIKKEDDKDRDRASRRNKSRSPHRDNSKPRDRIRRSRSRERDYRGRDRLYRGRKSPVRRHDRQDRDVWDRRRSPPARNRSASPRTRSPVAKYRRSFNSRSKSRSRSPIAVRSPAKDTKDVPPGTGIASHIQTSTHFPETRMPEPTSEVIPDASNVMRGSPVPTKVPPPEGFQATPLTVNGNRCRDFDERGLCMRGEFCPFDHGCNPVVLEDAARQNALKQVVANAAALGELPEFQMAEPIMFPPGMMRHPRPPHIVGSDLEPMDRGWAEGHMFRPRHNFRGRGMVRHGYMGPPRELISVPVHGQPPMPMADFPPMPMQPQIGHHRGMNMRGMMRGRGAGRGTFDHARLGAKSYRNNANCSLEVKRIPREQNNIMDLNSHFWRFGKIVNIQINFESDPEAALITFATPAEAYAAYRSTDAVLNNRFVKVFWHNKEKENDDVDVFPAPLSIRDRLGPVEGAVENMDEDKVIISGNNLTKTVSNPNAIKKEPAPDRVEAVEAIKRSQEQLAAQACYKREQAEKKKEAMLMQNDLHKRQQEMLSEQITQQKMLIKKIESGKGIMKPEEIGELMAIVKTLQESIEKIKSDLDKSSSAAPRAAPNMPAAVATKNKDDTQKEILDAELDLYNKELEGGDTLALKRKVLELRSQAQAAGLFRGRGGYRGLLRSFANRGRGAMRSLRRVDRRPTKIIITGHPVGRSNEMLAHFAQYGGIESYETDVRVPSLTIKYENRKSAEVAMSQGRQVSNLTLDLQWGTNNSADGPEKKSNNAANGEASKVADIEHDSPELDELGDLYVDQLDLYDQYDDEEEEERSWRR